MLKQFLASILDDPSPIHKLACADWLEENAVNLISPAYEIEPGGSTIYE
jgi:hypothetical protein